jgi:hypothetical protein
LKQNLYFKFGSSSERNVAGGGLCLPLFTDFVPADKLLEVGAQVPSEQSFIWGNGKQGRQQLGGESRLVHHQSTVNTYTNFEFQYQEDNLVKNRSGVKLKTFSILNFLSKTN